MILGKTQHEVENGYSWIDLPRLIEISGERHAKELLENIEVATFPHLSDEKARLKILKQHSDKLPKPPPVPAKSAEEQYKALQMRMRGG